MILCVDLLSSALIFLSNSRLIALSLELNRISGLESHSALLVLTQSNLHILSGVQKFSRKKEDRSVYWAPRQAMRGEWSSKSAASAAGHGLAAVDKSRLFTDDEQWLAGVWSELLATDLCYQRMSLNKVRGRFLLSLHEMFGVIPCLNTAVILFPMLFFVQRLISP